MPNGSIIIAANPGKAVTSITLTTFDQITGALETNTESSSMKVVNQGTL